MNKTGNKQAFPAGVNATSGLTKREYFAGLAMQGMMAQMGQLPGHPSEYGIGKQAVAIADDLLAELEKPQS